MRKISLILTATLGPIACGGSPGQPSPDGAALAYTVPATNPLRYELADTTTLGMEMGGTVIDIAIKSSATADARFEAADAGVTAAISYQTLSGAFTNSMAAPINIGARDLPGPASLSVDRNGRITAIDLPETSPSFRQVLGAEGAFRRLIVNLPGAVVAVGTTWTDTVTVTEDLGEMASTSTDIIRSTLGRDTTINGRSYKVIRSEIDADTRINGATQGMEVSQSIRTTSTAVTLWDPALRAVYQRTESGTGIGSMAMPAMGVTGVPITIRSKSVVRLLPR